MAADYQPMEMLTALNKAVTQMHLESQSVHGDWQEIHRSLQMSVNSANRGLLGAFTKVIGLHPALEGVATSFKNALSPKGGMDEMEAILAKSEHGLQAHAAKMAATLAALNAAPNGNIQMAGSQAAREAAHKAAQEAYAAEETRHRQLGANFNLQKEMHRTIHGVSGVLIPAMVLGFKEAWKTTFEINKSFKEATTDGWQRYQLLRTTLNVQRETGASTDEINKAMQALVTHGFDLDQNLGAVAKTVTMMELGLGVSADKSAELASSFRNLGQPITSAANGIARIQRDTALSATHATQYYTQIAKALSLLKPGSGGMAAQVGELVSQFEAASQKVLGRSGDITKLITEMSGMEGMTVAAQLGMQPDFMADPAKVDEALRRLNEQVNNRLAGTSGMGRVAMLEALSQQYGIQKDVLANLNKVMEERNKQTLSQTTLESVYTDQMKLLGNSFAQIKNILMAAMRSAFSPVVLVLAEIVNGLRTALDWMVNFTAFGLKPLAAALTVGVVIVGGVATWQMWRLARALWQVAAAGKAAEISTAAGGFSASGFRGALSSMARWGTTVLPGGKLAGVSGGGLAAQFSRMGLMSQLGLMTKGLISLPALITGALSFGLTRYALAHTEWGKSVEKAVQGHWEEYFMAKYGRSTTSEDPSSKTTQHRNALDTLQEMAEDGASKADIMREAVRSLSTLAEFKGATEEQRLKMTESFLGQLGSRIELAKKYSENSMLTEKSTSDMALLQKLEEIRLAAKSGGEIEQKADERRLRLEKIESDQRKAQWNKRDVRELVAPHLIGIGGSRRAY